MSAFILVVDGDPEIRETIETVFGLEGWSVTSAGTAEAALKLLRTRTFDTVITDIRMPDISGPEFLDRIREVDAHVEIIVLTGFTTIQNVIKALRDVGAADYLSKPLNDMDELVSAVKRVFRKRK